MALTSALIVDDSKLARITLRKKLEKLGFSVALAESAEQAFTMLEGNCPDIIFMDHLMPDIDGFEATQKLRAMPAFANLPIVMCSGKDHEGYLQEAQAIGANFTLIKPPSNEALEDIMKMDFTVVSSIAEEPTEELVASLEPAIDTPIEIADEIEVMAVVEENVLTDDPLGLANATLNEITADVVTENSLDVPVDSNALKDAVIETVSDAGLSALDVEQLISSKVKALLAQQQQQIVQDIQAQMPKVEASGLDEAAVQVLIESSLSVKLPQLTQQLTSELMPQLSDLIAQGLAAVDVPAAPPSTEHLQALEALSVKLAQTEQNLLEVQQQFDAFKIQDTEMIHRALTALKAVA